MIKTEYEKAMEETQALIKEQEAEKGELLGKINIEDAIDILIRHLKDHADTDEVVEVLQLVAGAYIELDTETAIDDPILMIYKTPCYWDIFQGKLKK